MRAKDVDAGRRLANEAGMHFLGRERLLELQFHDLVATDDAQSKRLSEDHARHRMKTLGGTHWQPSTAEHAFEDVHEIVMTDLRR